MYEAFDRHTGAVSYICTCVAQSLVEVKMHDSGSLCTFVVAVLIILRQFKYLFTMNLRIENNSFL